jgi:hypothetical protein
MIPRLASPFTRRQQEATSQAISRLEIDAYVPEISKNLQFEGCSRKQNSRMVLVKSFSYSISNLTSTRSMLILEQENFFNFRNICLTMRKFYAILGAKR